MTTILVTGIIGPERDPNLIGESSYGIDRGGFFGGGSIAGDPFTVTWEADICNCDGGPFISSSNPVHSAIITINGHSYTYDTPAYSEVIYDGNFVQINVFGSNQGALFTSVVQPGVEGVFYIQPCCNASLWTQGFLDIQTFTIGVPSPIAGEGAILIILLGSLLWKSGLLKASALRPR